MTTAYPLSWPAGWPRTPWQKQKNSAPFKTTFDKARRDLTEELRRLGATDVVISSWLPLRNDGFPRADVARRRLDDAGVAVYFTFRKRRMVMARDAYSNIHDNIRSITLAIMHLRGMERHGGAHMMEKAFEGFAQIEAPGRKHWTGVLGLNLSATKDQINAAFKELARQRHPDFGGSDSAMAELNAARESALRECAA